MTAIFKRDISVLQQAPAGERAALRAAQAAALKSGRGQVPVSRALRGDFGGAVAVVRKADGTSRAFFDRMESAFNDVVLSTRAANRRAGRGSDRSA